MAFDPNEFEAVEPDLPAPADPAAAPAPGPGPAPAPTAGFDPSQFESWDSQAMNPDASTRRVNMVGAQNELVDVAPEDLERAYASGFRLDPLEVAGQRTVSLLAPDGSVRTFEGGDPAVQEAFAAGAKVATPAEVAREYGDAGSTFGAGAEGLAQGATLGLYGLAADSIGGDDYRAERLAREEASPIVSTVANIAGAAAPALLSGGTSSLASAAALTPAARLSALGLRMADALTVKAAGAGGRILAGTISAGLEGAIDNAARVVADDLAAGDVDITAERMADAMWDGATVSAIFGLGGSAIGEGLGRLRAGRAAGELAEDLPPALPEGPDVPQLEATRPREAIEADIDAARNAIDQAELNANPNAAAEAEDALAAALQEQEQAVMAAERLTPDADIAATLNVAPSPEVLGLLGRIDANLNTVKNARELRTRFKDEADTLATSITEDVDALSKFGTNTFDTYTNRSNKPKVIRAQLEADGVQWNPEAAERILKRVEQMETVLEEMGDIKQHAIYKDVQLKAFKAGRESMKKLKEHLTGLRAQGPIAPDARVLRGGLEDVAETFHGLDLFKSHLGSFAAQMNGRPATTSEATFQRLYMTLRADLQDPRIFGKALAEMQTVTNAAITRAIRKDQLFRQGFARAGSSEGGGQFGFADVIEFDPRRVGAMVDDLANPRAFKDARDFVAGLTARVELMETLAKYYPMPDAAKARIVQARGMLEGVKTKMQGAKALSMRVAEADRLAAQTSNLQDIINAVRTLPVGGAAIAGVAGTVTGMARGLSAALLNLGKGAAKQERAVQKAARETVKVATEVMPPAPAKKLTKAQVAKLEAEPRAIRGLGITANQVRRAVEEAREAEDPESPRSQAIIAQLREVEAESPELAAALANQMRMQAAFIASKAGPAVDDSDPFRSRPPLLDPVTERSVARYVAAARYPEKAFARIAQGKGTKEDRETLKVLQPRRFEAFVKAVVEHAKKVKTPPTIQQRARLHQSTGVPMSREQQPEKVARTQAAYAQAAQEQPEATPDSLKPMVPPSKAKGEFKADQRFASRSDVIMGEYDG